MVRLRLKRKLVKLNSYISLDHGLFSGYVGEFSSSYVNVKHRFLCSVHRN